MLKYAVSIILVLVLATVYAFTRSESPLVDQLQNPDYARGVITFIVSAVVVCLALILILGALFLEGTATNEVEQRFRRGREVLAPFVGILGTIVGFYFGSAERTGAVSKLDVDALSSPTEITVRVSGGFEPYRVTMIQDGKQVFGPEAAERGWMRVPVTQIKLTGDTPKLLIEATDAKDRKATREVIVGAGSSPPAGKATPSAK
ncbi:MAG: hypothetical protein ABWY12_01940 [Burkholderiales bacterium]